MRHARGAVSAHIRGRFGGPRTSRTTSSSLGCETRTCRVPPKNTTFLRNKTKKRPCVTWIRYRGVGSGGSSTPRTGVASHKPPSAKKKPPRRPVGKAQILNATPQSLHGFANAFMLNPQRDPHGRHTPWLWPLGPAAGIVTAFVRKKMASVSAR